MKSFDYERATTVTDAISAMAPSGKFMAGGTTLYDLMKLDIERPDKIVDINFLGLDAIEVEPDGLVLGASVRMSEAAQDKRIIQDYPALSEALWKAASEQLRNMASLGGNLLQRTRCGYFRHGEPYACNKRVPGSGCAAQEGLNRYNAILGGSDDCIAVYPGDFAIALIAFDAEIYISGPDNMRKMPFSNLHVMPGSKPDVETTLAPDEIITGIRIPNTAAARASTYHKVRDRESYAFALVSAAAGVAMDGDIVDDVRLALGGVATVPWRANAAEASLIGEPLTRENAERAGRIAFQGSITSEHNAFKTELGAQTVADALMIAKERV